MQTETDQGSDPETPPSPVVGPSKPRLLSILGPGLITGASDDDPSGIATYSQAGAQFGYGLTWTTQGVWVGERRHHGCGCDGDVGNLILRPPCFNLAYPYLNKSVRHTRAGCRSEGIERYAARRGCSQCR